MAKHKILVVDDELPITKLLKIVLERTGKFTVRTENEASSVMKAAAEFAPDLILLDINLSDANGGEIADRFKKDESLKSIPIIFLTGAVSPSEVEGGMSTIGGRPVVAKPINMEHLVEIIEKNFKS